MYSKIFSFFRGGLFAAFECDQIGDQIPQLVAAEHPRETGRHGRALFIKVFSCHQKYQDFEFKFHFLS